MPNSPRIFQNPDSQFKPKSLLDTLKWKFASKKLPWPHVTPPESLAELPPSRVANDRIYVSFVGHATFLIQTNGLNILTDPVWSERASPFSFLGPKRLTKPGIKLDDLPAIDLVLISHNHYDHLDINTIKKLWARDKPQIIAPLLNDLVIKSHIPAADVKTIDWAEKISVNNDINICLEPAQHWSARGLFDRNRALWGTFIITTTTVGDICFIGDSGYNPRMFKEIGDKYNISVSLIPIGAYEPRWFMKDVHMNPEEAVLTHQDLKSKYSIASHFNTFSLADDSFAQAASDLAEARNKNDISYRTFITPKSGSIYQFVPDKNQALVVSATNF